MRPRDDPFRDRARPGLAHTTHAHTNFVDGPETRPADAGEVSRIDDCRRAGDRDCDRPWRRMVRRLPRFLSSNHPLPEGDRIVEIEMRNPRIAGDERRLLHDFMIWRQELNRWKSSARIARSSDAVGGAGESRTGDGSRDFGLGLSTRARAADSRPSLIEADEAPGAPGVVVLGYHVWQQRFGGRADVIGQTVQLGRATSTVVGVMPEGFAFPINHRMWYRCRFDPAVMRLSKVHRCESSAESRTAQRRSTPTRKSPPSPTACAHLRRARTSTCGRACWRMGVKPLATARRSSSSSSAMVRSCSCSWSRA